MTAPLSVTLTRAADYDEWRHAARKLLLAGARPDQVAFRHASDTLDLFAATGTDGAAGTARPAAHQQPGFSQANAADDPDRSANPTGSSPRVPKDFPELAKRVICHRDPTRYALLYRLLWRLQREPQLLENRSDKEVWSARRMAKSVRRDAHKMKAFVRFRRIEDQAGEAFVAWFEPQHRIVEYTAPFFMRRFTGMRWSIVTPERSAHWDGNTLRYGDGAARRDCPDGDALESYWRVYYSSIFNPARLKLNAMRAEMPVKYWRNLPESRLIPELSRSARKAQRAAPAGTAPSVDIAQRLVAQQPGMQTPVTERPRSLDQIADALQSCQRCRLCEYATAAVPGEGPRDARIMLVGEQPGDQEDLSGRPFVGPAGEVLDDALEQAGIARDSVYLTNAVKHFKHTLRGKRRIHQRPNQGEIEHCRWWLGLEREILAPDLIVALGATAARAVLGRSVRIADVRGQLMTGGSGEEILVTVHPAYLLRLPERDKALAEKERFVDDLRAASARLDQRSPVVAQPDPALH